MGKQNTGKSKGDNRMSVKINILEIETPNTLQPISCTKKLSECHVAGISYIDALKWRLEHILMDLNRECPFERVLNIRSDFWPSLEIIHTLFQSFLSKALSVVIDGKNIPVAWFSKGVEPETELKSFIGIDNKSHLIIHPWDLLYVNEDIISTLEKNDIQGTVKENVNIDGFVEVGEGTVLLPGVYIEGNVIIGENCKIGPNCYIRGNTYIGHDCHVGQAVEIKNSILMDKVKVGHLSYVGDSILCTGTNFGAGTITANLRHDGNNHKSFIKNKLIDTTRRKLGVIVGDGVHTGINTSFYPGRKLWPNTSTSPGEIVKKDKK
jgi:UDP-N-acetylglucosamine diphosphorylase / glucose-1-phosphate thymidylyltransferase / UDP-N-acetylgalactosamine diphosphorylase / glucosamine-1-phosphate N-acetyltransferase / galactosamine-1-phosphate N-acetyltransferase